MGQDSKIEWTDHTFNPWIGCAKVSDGCKNCYAEISTPVRISRSRGFELWGEQAQRRPASEAMWREPAKWNSKAEQAGERRRVFCASLADVFEDRPDLVALRQRLFLLIEQTPRLDWLLLTKRPENVRRLVHGQGWIHNGGSEWPRNAWIGCTVESQARGEERLPHLLAIPAPIRFVSYEPALGPVDFSRWMWPVHWSWDSRYPTPEAALAAGASAKQHQQALVHADARFIDWLIIGGESGKNARPFDLAWARSAVRQCKAAGVPVFVKQMGARATDSDTILGNQIQIPQLFEERKGGDPLEWPEDLRVRETPGEVPQ